MAVLIQTFPSASQLEQNEGFLSELRAEQLSFHPAPNSCLCCSDSSAAFR